MIKFIILDKSPYMRDVYVKTIKKYMYTSLSHSEIVEYNKWSSSIYNDINTRNVDKIYIINSVFDNKDGFAIARKIRNSGDLESQIIMVCSVNYKLNFDIIKGTLILSAIKQDENIVSNLYKSISAAYKILMRHTALTFSSFDEVYRIPYDNIYLVEKNYKDDSVTIYTKDDSINRYVAIKTIMQELSDDPRFLKTNRSCIINLHKVVSYDCISNTIYFDNGMTTKQLSTRERQNFKNRLKMYNK